MDDTGVPVIPPLADERLFNGCICEMKRSVCNVYSTFQKVIFASTYLEQITGNTVVCLLAPLIVFGFGFSQEA